MAYSKFRFKDLTIWNDSVKIVSDVYKETRKLPKDELFGLVSQIRRAVVSIPTNIAEGSGSNSKKDFCNFLNISRRSCFEVSSLLEICQNLNYLDTKDVIPIEENLTIITRQITAFQKTISYMP